MKPELSKSDKITTLGDFLKWTQSLTPGEYLFRGVSDTEHKIEASAYRRLEKKDKNFDNFLEINKELIKDARLQGLGVRDGRDLKDLEILAALQHAGAATCLIDFTYSALIALWFACGNESPDDGTDGKVVAMSSELSGFKEITPKLLGQEINYFLKKPAEGDSGEFYQWRPWQLNDRIGAQHSIFLFGHFEIKTGLKCLIDKDSKNIIRMQLQQSGNITEAILFSDLDGFSRLRGHGVQYGRPPDSEYIIEYKKSAESARDRSKYSEVIDSYNYVIQLNPRDAEAYLQRGLAKYNLKQYEAAINDFNEAIKRSPRDADTYYQRGLAKYALKQYEAAIDDFNEAIKRDLNDVNIYYQRGLAKYNLKQYEAAIDDFNKVIFLEPDRAEVYYQRGMGYCNLEDYKKAIIDFNEVVDLDEDHRWVYYNRGQAKYHLKKFKEAEADVQTALQKAEEASDIDLMDRIGEFMRIYRLRGS